MSPPAAVVYESCALAEAGEGEACAKASAEAETLIFVDIDGVLNVGIRDADGAPLQFSEDNAERALSRWDQRGSMLPSHRIAVERIVATCGREVGKLEGAPYTKLLSAPGTSLNDLLVGRLARLIEAAGPRCQVVLSSTWRLPRHLRRTRQVESAISRHLGRYFAFDARTQIRDDRTPELRLQCVADFAADYCRKTLSPGKQLRVLVLEDFHTTPMGTWSCGRQKMSDVGAVEQYVRSCCPSWADASVRLIHTYDEWTSDDGLQVQLGCGLTKELFEQGMTFLQQDAADCSGSDSDDPQETPVPAITVGGLPAAAAATCATTRKGTDWLKVSDALAHAILRTVPCVG